MTIIETQGIDIVSACRRYLAMQTELYSVLGSDDNWDLWLFQETLFTRVESSQKTACVLRQSGSWTQPNQHNHMRFPRLVTDFYADPDRDSGNNNSEPLSAKDKILVAHEVVDRFLHFTMLDERWWPDSDSTGAMRVLNSARAGEIEWTTVPDGDGLMRGSVTYNLGVG